MRHQHGMNVEILTTNRI